MAKVELLNVSKRYAKGSDAVRGLSLEIADGEFVSLVGPSGCGKSTTLNLIAGLERITEGEVRIDGRVVNDLEPVDRDVAMVFQSYALYPHLTVAQNLAFPLRMRNAASDEIARRVRDVSQRLALTELLERKPSQLSGGQRQRVAVGRAMVRRPKVFLFDEPLSNLDPGLRAQLRAEIKKLHEELRATFVYVTHDQQEAMTLSDRIALLDRGVLQQVGAPRELYERPRTRFVAEFFGTPKINIVTGKWADAPGCAHVGFRPEHVELSTAAAPAGFRIGKVFLVEPVGAESWVTIDSAEGERLTAKAPADFERRSGETVWFKVDPNRILRFDANGERL